MPYRQLELVAEEKSPLLFVVKRHVESKIH